MRERKSFSRFLLLLSFACLLPAYAGAQSSAQSDTQSDTLKACLSEYFKHYTAPAFQPTGVCKLLDFSVDSATATININTNDVFGSQPFTARVINSIYASLSRHLPAEYQKYKLNIYSENRPLSDLIPNPYRQKRDKSRLWGGKKYSGEPWTFNASRPYVFLHGLQGKHLSVCSSHGRYYSHQDASWQWQRPYLFCTTEDLLTQTFVVPFLIPMLENAGAVVYSPRERSWQTGEVIVDNDAAAANGQYAERQDGGQWQQSAVAGFAAAKAVLHDGENPFTMGTSRIVAATRNSRRVSMATWIPKLPSSGRYAVYVSYPSVTGSVPDARYTVIHGGERTNINVNQRMGGETWVYLGTFYFEAGQNARNCVTLSNFSAQKGYVGADAVRFGGGMGNIARGEDASTGEPLTSRLPRYLEGARYAAQWGGFPYSAYSSYSGADDYKDDINARSYAANYLAGGSIFSPNAEGKRVPLELSLAVHSDAGYKGGGIVGTMSISTTGGGDEHTYPGGVSRKSSYDFASMLCDGVAMDMSRIYRFAWPRREVYDKNYSESYRPSFPAAIIETLAHQNFRDMIYAHDPWFKFNFARGIYKSILRFITFEHGEKYTVAPLAPESFYVEFTGEDEVTLHWSAVKDSLEPTATPTGYILYVRRGDGDFDSGTYLKRNSYTMKLRGGTVYGFRVTAVNAGGESFPTETLAACRANTQARPVLIVNCFDRLSGPAVIEKEDSVGFDIYDDIGVPYIETPEYSGAQINFDPAHGGDDSQKGLGRSGYELAGKLIRGNTFDYPSVHGKAIAQKYSFVSASRKAVEKGRVNLGKYPVVDLIFGLQKRGKYDFKNFKTFNSALRTKINAYLSGGGSLLTSGAYIGSDMHSSADREFLSSSLHCSYAGSVRQEESISGAMVRFRVEQKLGRDTYAVQRMDCLRPASGAQGAFKYSDGKTAGVIWQGTKARCATLGFPLESITSRESLRQVMGNLMKFLMHEDK